MSDSIGKFIKIILINIKVPERKYQPKIPNKFYVEGYFSILFIF